MWPYLTIFPPARVFVVRRLRATCAVVQFIIGTVGVDPITFIDPQRHGEWGYLILAAGEVDQKTMYIYIYIYLY